MTTLLIAILLHPAFQLYVAGAIVTALIVGFYCGWTDGVTFKPSPYVDWDGGVEPMTYWTAVFIWPLAWVGLVCWVASLVTIILGVMLREAFRFIIKR